MTLSMTNTSNQEINIYSAVTISYAIISFIWNKISLLCLILDRALTSVSKSNRLAKIDWLILDRCLMAFQYHLNLARKTTLRHFVLILRLLSVTNVFWGKVKTLANSNFESTRVKVHFALCQQWHSSFQILRQ